MEEAMKIKTTLGVLAVLSIAAALLAISRGGSVASAAGTNGNQVISVREQNLDSNHSIKVHEQGVAQVHEQGVAQVQEQGVVQVQQQGVVQVQQQLEPFQATLKEDSWVSGGFANLSFTVPDGKMLILRTVSVSAYVPAGQSVQADLTANGTNGALVGDFQVPLANQGTFDGLDFYSGTEQITGYAAALSGGAFVHLERSSSAGAGSFIEATVTGKLVAATG
jgi:hypothetical protein